MSKICITGGTGLIGRRLTSLLSAQGHEVLILSRSAKAGAAGISYATWNPERGTIDGAAVRDCDAIIHLAGAGVAEKRWTKKRKAEILNSRTHSSALLVQALKEDKGNVKAVISSSAIGWYGADRESGTPFTETDPPHSDFLGQTCLQWEQSIEPVEQSGIRLVKLRTGIVLSNEGGALKEFKKPLQFGLASVLGSGKQIISWIHIDDLCRMFLHALQNEKLHGSYNAAAPKPVSNKELTLKLAKKMRGNAFITAPVPSFVLKLILGEMSIEVLKSTTVSAEKIQQSGFQFLYPSIDAALNELITS
ncbi:TIGR01777 family oxidoreductase [Lacibacter sp. MH-610]|uniref:TIGR01777 family oxidoreductase n=1 Tax=Lacibacter sp. MH-610 TaxID=3020883 RepID=UPI0038923E8C